MSTFEVMDYTREIHQTARFKDVQLIFYPLFLNRPVCKVVNDPKELLFIWVISVFPKLDIDIERLLNYCFKITTVNSVLVLTS